MLYAKYRFPEARRRAMDDLAPGYGYKWETEDVDDDFGYHLHLVLARDRECLRTDVSSACAGPLGAREQAGVPSTHEEAP